MPETICLEGAPFDDMAALFDGRKAEGAMLERKKLWGKLLVNVAYRQRALSDIGLARVPRDAKDAICEIALQRKER